VSVLLAALLVVLVITAWQCDDAFITFRTARNFWSGHGLRWNPDERVQAYTHPLWALAAVVLHGVFRETYFSVLVLSAGLTLAAAALLWWPLRSHRALLLAAAAALLASSAFADYSVCGLENPALGLLLVLAARPSRPLLHQVLIASVIALVRLDAVLFVAPVLAWEIVRARPVTAALRPALLGAAPLLAWELFSLAYYGFFVPNTAFAKLNLDLPRAEVLLQGVEYFADGLRRDPATLLVTLAAVSWCAVRGETRERLCAAGVVLYLAYVGWIGGDFMAGRFFYAPLIASLAVALPLAAAAPPRRSALVAIAAALGLYVMVARIPRWREGAAFGEGLEWDDVVQPTGIADERAYYYPHTGLLRVLRDGGSPTPPYPGAVRGAAFESSGLACTVENEVGFFGYFAGAKRVIDAFALADPLLARLPFRPDGPWRIGHYRRRIPAGYVQTRCGGENHIEDPELARAYAALSLVIRGPLFSTERWVEIWRLNTGAYRAAFARPDYR
jgi:arabinofuranosyltransferase